MRIASSPYEDLETGCPMLGHPVPLRYCLEPGSELPCRRIVLCWQERFDIAGLLREVLTPEQLEELEKAPKQKISQLLELVAKVKKGS